MVLYVPGGDDKLVGTGLELIQLVSAMDFLGAGGDLVRENSFASIVGDLDVYPLFG